MQTYHDEATQIWPAREREEQVLAALRRIARALSLYSHYVQKKCGITGPQLMVLREVERSEGVSVRALADRVSLSHPTLTGILDRLERRNLAVRRAAADDRRRREVTLTGDGRDLLRRAPPVLQGRFLEAFRGLQDWEQTLLLSSLQRVSAMMGAQDLDAAPLLVDGEGDATEWADLEVLGAGERSED